MTRRSSRRRTESKQEGHHKKIKASTPSNQEDAFGACPENCHHTHILTHNTPADLDTHDSSKQSKIIFATHSSSLLQIQETDVQLAVLRPNNQTDVRAVLADPSHPLTSLPTYEGLVSIYDATSRLNSFLNPRYPLRSKSNRALNDHQMTDFIQEMNDLIQVFAEITGSEFVHVNLHIVHDDGCSLWHQDCVDNRLITTYRGACTEYVLPQYSTNTLLQKSQNSPHAQSLLQGDVAIFKGRGETLEGEELLFQPGIVHRSPRYSGERLVLILDIPQEGWHY